MARVYLTVSRAGYFNEFVTTEEELDNVVKMLKKEKIIKKNADYYTYKAEQGGDNDEMGLR